MNQAESPSPGRWEREKLVAALRDPAWRRKTLWAVSGKATWFDILAGVHLPAEMRKPPGEAQDAVWVLVSAFAFARDRCLDLMEAHWLGDDDRLKLLWQALFYLESWSAQAVRLAVTVVNRVPTDQARVWHSAQAIAKTDPGSAVALLAAWLDAACRRVGESTPGDLANQIEKLLDDRGQWFDIVPLAERAPTEFARRLWPVLVRITTHLEPRYSGLPDRYTKHRLGFGRLDRREYVAYDSPEEFLRAMDAAMRGMALMQPGEFCALVQKAGNPDSMLLQRLLCRGLREAAATHPAVALDYLTADPRRFALGGMDDDQLDSIELVAALGPHLTDEQLGRLVGAIRAWAVYSDAPDDADPNDMLAVYARGERFRLLESLPAERLLGEARQLVERERLALPEHARTSRGIRSSGIRLIGSPVSGAELAEMPDDEVAEVLAKFPDATGSHSPDDWMVGGSVQLAREFEKFTGLNPARAVAMVARLRPGFDERVAAHAVRGLVEAKRPAEEVIALAARLDERGFAGWEFRETVAFALAELAVDGGLPDAACDLLDRWRRADWPPNTVHEADHDERTRSASILWDSGGTVSLPGRRFAVLSALTRGYLCRQPHAADLWLAMLRDHVERDENPTNWKVMCLFLGNLRCCSEPDDARAFLDRLVERFPDVLGCALGARLLAGIDGVLTPDARRRTYESARRWPGEGGSQAFGELVCLRHLRHPEDAWARGQVELALAAGEPDREPVALGVAFSAANLWEEPAGRVRATELLCRMLARPEDRLAAAALTVFRTRDEIPQDEATLDLYRQAEACPEVLGSSGADEGFFEHLVDAFDADPDLACRLAEETVRRRGAAMRSGGHGLDMASPALLDIALRLQRSGGGHRERGMTLFEELLDLGVSEAVAVAQSNDLRLAPGVAVRMPRRRRKSGGANDNGG